MPKHGLDKEPVCALLETTGEIDSLLRRAIESLEQEKVDWFRRWLGPSKRTEIVLVLKALGTLHDRIATVQHELTTQEFPPPEGVAALRRVLKETKRVLAPLNGSDVAADEVLRDLPEHLVWMLDGDLRSSLATIGSPIYLQLQARALAAKRQVDDPSLAAELEGLATNLAADPQGDDRNGGGRSQRDRARSRLSQRDRARRQASMLLLDGYGREAKVSRHDRAREVRRGQLLRWSAFLLSVFVAGLAISLTLGRVLPATETVIALMAGAFGGSLSGMRRIRDELERLTQLDAFSSALAAQLLAAGGLGILAAVLFTANVLPDVAGSPDNLVVVIYAFAAGFSEPFVIGAVRGLVDESASKKTSA